MGGGLGENGNAASCILEYEARMSFPTSQMRLKKVGAHSRIRTDDLPLTRRLLYP